MGLSKSMQRPDGAGGEVDRPEPDADAERRDHLGSDGNEVAVVHEVHEVHQSE